jgi:hypothetical protein
MRARMMLTYDLELAALEASGNVGGNLEDDAYDLELAALEASGNVGGDRERSHDVMRQDLYTVAGKFIVYVGNIYSLGCVCVVLCLAVCWNLLCYGIFFILT